ncbi:MAG TPA: RcnB family protein [Xanthobacteraceae bacterium]|nr:RcnB family protein [Xanthobacteraceae bacterium]
MLRSFALAAIMALALSGVAAAQPHDEHEHHPPPPHGPPPHPPGKPVVVPHGPVHPGPAVVHPGAAQFNYRGHMISRVHIAPFIYPPGWAYRQWAVGAMLPPLFLERSYWYADWAALGLPPPQPGYEWVRYGPDLLLVEIATGRVVDVAYGVFY